jgi:hypothetical protein
MASLFARRKPARQSSFSAVRRGLARLLVLAGALTPAWPAASQTPVLPVKPFIMTLDSAADSYAGQWARLAYREAFRRMNITVEIVDYTLARRTALIEAGAVDGEGSRIAAYADAHPELIRVEESLIDFTFSIYTASPKLAARRLEDLPANAVVEYRRGVLMCENTLKKLIPAARLSTITSIDQGIKKLQAERTDAYCDLELYVREALHGAEFRGGATVRKLFDIASVPTYPYLAKRHADLAPRLAATLKQMKAEGLLDSYHKQVERQMGWSR